MGPKEPTVDTARAQCMVHPIASLTLVLNQNGVIRNMCKHNPPSAQPTYKDKKSDLIYKRVFCDFI